MDTLKTIFFISCVILTIGCTPKISHITYETDFKKWNKVEHRNVVDSSASLDIEVNTYKRFFEGRSPFSFEKNYYYFTFNKIDTFYTEKNISSFSQLPKAHSIYPKFLRVEVKYLENEYLLVKLDIKDDSLPDLFNGVFKLKCKNQNPSVENVFKYYE